MGIKRLFTFMKDDWCESSLENFRDTTMGIDGMGWLYQAFFSVNEDKERIHIPIVRKFESRFRLLAKYDIKPIVVIDGRNLQIKNFALNKRQQKREYYQAQASKYEEGQDAGQLAVYEKYAQEVSIDLVYIFVDYLKHKGYEYIIAPYEADSQLAFMLKKGYIHHIISEDSDFFAMTCYNLIRGIRKDGSCMVFNYEAASKKTNLTYSKMFLSLDDTSRAKLCALVGCDYIDNPKGIGFVTLIHFFYDRLTYSSKQLDEELAEFIEHRSGISGTKHMREIEKICSTFMHQVVYNPYEKKLVHCNEPPHNCEKLTKYVGEFFENYMDFVEGKLDFETLKVRSKSDYDFEKIVRFVNHVSSESCGRLNNLCSEAFGFDNFTFEGQVDAKEIDDIELPAPRRGRKPKAMALDASEKLSISHAPTRSAMSTRRSHLCWAPTYTGKRIKTK